MVIKEEKPITLSEVYELVGDSEHSLEVRNFLKKFIKLDFKKAKELEGELVLLDLVKLRDVHIIKIIDFLPKSAVELNKVLTDVSLEDGEIKKILDVVNKY